jgi:hypothetical protein
MRAIIICAGEATRWNNHLGVPKHLAPVDGEPILNRAVRLLQANGVSDIHVVSKDDPRYAIEGASQLIPTLNYADNADADKFLSSKQLWNQEGRTVVFYGDVYFTEAGMARICEYTGTEWTLFCRRDSSKYTGTPWGECFAQSFYPADIPKHEAALHRIAKLYKAGIINRCGGWEHYHAMIGLPDHQVRSTIFKGNFVEIDDFTDDFDYPEDYDRFLARRKQMGVSP